MQMLSDPLKDMRRWHSQFPHSKRLLTPRACRSLASPAVREGKGGGDRPAQTAVRLLPGRLPLHGAGPYPLETDRAETVYHLRRTQTVFLLKLSEKKFSHRFRAIRACSGAADQNACRSLMLSCHWRLERQINMNSGKYCLPHATHKEE